MPTYTETRSEIVASAANIASIESAINRRKDIGGGYQALIVFSGKSGRVTTTLKGAQTDVNRIPNAVLIKYAQVLNKVRRWMDDLEADFPTL